MKADPDMFKYLPLPLFDVEADFNREVYDKYIKHSPEDCLFAVFDKVTAAGSEDPSKSYAGLMSLTHTNPENAVTEIGVIVFPAFQRTHVGTNAIGLLLMWTLDRPSAGGLGLRRVEWQTHTENAASRRTALRMGFEFEGIARWQRVVLPGKVGLPVDALQERNGTKEEGRGRSSAIFSIVWDEWDEKRPSVVAQMERRL
ncbi:hypothetical protein LTR36_004774 [Oleoguttula mirabilis]|uniref:N-acetyltransferase domain-containing protein n=1 Tax=Oleoguttula mirabilis TaxID=1507867 RepID=A0AAV9JG45_9PEZI|nr:hypothetical protein LTR36_004774 [Oleoguttula mirabilis]